MINIRFFNNTKLFLFVLGFCFTCHSILGQSTNTEYFISSSFSKSSLNPSKRPNQGYIGIPILTNVMLGYKTNTFNLDHFLFPGVGENGKAGWFLHQNVSYDDFIQKISENNYLDVNLNFTWLEFGFYVDDIFFSFDVSSRGNASLNLPGDLFKFTKRGFALDENEMGTQYNFNHIGIDANVYTQIGLGSSFPLLDKKLMLGVKAKVLLGTLNARGNVDQVYINLEKNNWSIRSKASLQLSGPAWQAEFDENGKFINIREEGAFSLINGSGLGLDLGATLKLTDDLSVSAALTDLGFITWNKNRISLVNDSEETTIIGINREPINLDETEDILQKLQEHFDGAIAFKQDKSSGKRITGLGAKLNWGTEYALLDNQLNLGFLMTSCFNTVKTFSEFTVGGSYKLGAKVETGLSYSFVHSRFQTFGLALHLGSFFYIAGDYVIPHVNSAFIPTSIKAFNVQFGLAIPLRKKHE